MWGFFSVTEFQTSATIPRHEIMVSHLVSQSAIDLVKRVASHDLSVPAEGWMNHNILGAFKIWALPTKTGVLAPQTLLHI